MAIGNVIAACIEEQASTTKRFKTFLGRHFYLCMSLVLAGLVILGFSRTVNASLFRANPPQDRCFYGYTALPSQRGSSSLSLSRLWSERGRSACTACSAGLETGLAAVMVVLGCIIAVVMTRFDTVVLQQKGVDAFLSVPFADMIIFGSCIGMAIYWRKKSEYHRRLVFLASCQLMDAAIGRFDFMFNHNLFYLALDCLIALGMVRDWVVDKRVHKVYLYALPSLIVVQSLAIYAWRINPKWWQVITPRDPGMVTALRGVKSLGCFSDRERCHGLNATPYRAFDLR